MTTQPKLITYADYLEGPETKERKEIVDGVLIMFAAPTLNHQTLLNRVFVPSYLFVSQRELGQIWCAPVDVIVQQEPLRARQPDIVFVSNERSEILGERIEGGPDLVVEILSPSNNRTYISEKLADYARINVRECWLVSLRTRTVEILRLEAGEWQRAYIRGVGERIESAVLPGLELEIAGIFQGI